VQGTDVTLVGISHMQLECIRAKHYLDSVGISAEVIDPIWLSPLDIDTVVQSVRKTGRLCVVDDGWTTCGAGSEIVALVVERLQGRNDLRVRRMGFAPTTCPPTPPLENLFYPNGRKIASAVYDLVSGQKNCWMPAERPDLQEVTFKGPF
jgi:pyruvate/2-oxoglutarate/acetoin dehydrogenase E1 component